MLTQTRAILKLCFVLAWPTLLLAWPAGCLAQPTDTVRDLQIQAIKAGRATWGHWGTNSAAYYDWCNHSNRLVPVYTFGIDLAAIKNANSLYRRETALAELYGYIPAGTLNRDANYFDQTEIFGLQMAAARSGKKYIILMVFDGLDWQTTRAAAHFRSGSVAYSSGRGKGLRFQDYDRVMTDFGFCVTSPHNETTEFDVNAQRLSRIETVSTGGYDFAMAGSTPWDVPKNAGYLIGWDQLRYHPVTDSANSATALVTGRKTYNGAVNIDVNGMQLETVAHLLQQRGFSIGVVSNVPISHATPAAAYAHNVSRLDHQDLTRDLLGVTSVAHPKAPLPGVDVLIGAGWKDDADADVGQGANYQSGNKYLTWKDRQQIDIASGGRYLVTERTASHEGAAALDAAASEAVRTGARLLGFFGVSSGHLPYRTADGDYQPTDGVTPAEVYSAADIAENPKLADMTRAALTVLSRNEKGFWLMVEAGDVDWASHDVNIDNTIGAVLSGDEAFETITEWVEANNAWHETAIIVTSDHGHAFVLTDPQVFSRAGQLQTNN